MAADEKSLAEKLVNATKPGYDEHSKRIPAYDRAYEIYRASGRSPEGTEPWQSKLRVKYAMYNIDTALVNVIGGSPRAKVIPRNPESADRAKAFQSVLDYYTERAGVAASQLGVVQQAMVYGATAGKFPWKFTERQQTRRVYQDNPLGGDPLGSSIQTKKVTSYDGPCCEPWDIYDCWWDPYARTVDDAEYVVLRSYPSKEEILADPNYTNLDALWQSGDATDRNQTAQDKRAQAERRMRGRFELWEIWTNDRVIVLGNKSVVIRDDPNPYWHGQKPIAIATGRPDLFKLQGIPETELIDHLQEALWTIQNMRMDQLKMTVMRGLTYREGGVPDPNMLILRPRYRWPVSDHDDIKFTDPPPLPAEAYQEQSELMSQMEQVTGISPYVSGNISSSISHVTATSVSLLQQAATRILQFKGTMINNLFWQRMFNQWGDNVQQFMTEPVWARIVKGSEVAFTQVKPSDVRGDFDFKIVGADEVASKDVERQQALQLLQTLVPLAATGIVNFQPLVEKLAEAFDMPDPHALIAQQSQGGQPPMAPMPNGGQPNQGAAPGLPSNVVLPPGVQEAIMQGGR